MRPLRPRLARALARPPLETARLIRRELVLRASERRSQLTLARAARSRRPVLLGPFTGELGYELLYWIPLLRRELERHGIGPERCVALTRGGAGEWYRGLASRQLEIFDLVPPASYRAQLARRRARAGDAKQLRVEALDRELAARARRELGPAFAVHPSLLYARLRWLWSGVVPPSAALRYGDYRQLPRPAAPPAGLPSDYVVLKAYFNDCFPDSPASRAFLQALVERLARVVEVVLLSTGLDVDDHLEWGEAVGARVHRVDSLLTPRDNLAVQTRLVAGARALVSTYGGFSYLGPFLGVPTLAFSSVEGANPVHLAVLREGLPGSDYTTATTDDEAAVDRFVARLPAVRETAPA